jgi:hypothetical protein
MRIIKYIHKAPIRVFKIKQQRSRLKIRRSMLQVKFALEQEKQKPSIC